MTSTDMRWLYSGDCNPEYGGAWFDLSTWTWGYVDCVRVTDLDSGCGFRGAVMIEKITVYGMDDRDRIKEAVRACGGFDDEHYPTQQQLDAMTRRALRRSVNMGDAVPDVVLADRLSDDSREDDAQWVRGHAARIAARKQGLRLMIVDALMSYGHYDPAQPDHYFDDKPKSEIVQMEADGPMEFGGRRADKRLHNTDLRAYVESVWLD